MLKQRFFQLFYIALLVILQYSCQKVIPIDLNSASPHIVIEGNVTNQFGPYYVRIIKTVNFNDSNYFPPVTGAIVIIHDNLGPIQLNEVSPGIYSTTAFKGIPGVTYQLSVTTGGVEYTSSSFMDEPVKIDTLYIIKTRGFGGRTRNQVEVVFKDPEGIQNFYRFKVFVNGKESNNNSLTNDANRDGKLITRDIDLGDSTSVKSGDVVTVMLHCIDRATYDYFRTLRQASGSAGFLSASPSNPISNIDNGALGYFSAYSITTKVIVVE